AKKKLVLRKPPDKGFVHWDEATFQRLRENPPEPLESRFTLSHGMMINLLSDSPTGRLGGYHHLVELIERAHERPPTKKLLRRKARQLFRALLNAHVVEVVRATDKSRRFIRVHPHLQKDFSLFHTLSLYLVEALDALDKEHPNYALDVMSLAESVIE